MADELHLNAINCDGNDKTKAGMLTLFSESVACVMCMYALLAYGLFVVCVCVCLRVCVCYSNKFALVSHKWD